jgi:hypothetical protein
MIYIAISTELLKQIQTSPKDANYREHYLKVGGKLVLHTIHSIKASVLPGFFFSHSFLVLVHILNHQSIIIIFVLMHLLPSSAQLLEQLGMQPRPTPSVSSSDAILLPTPASSPSPSTTTATATATATIACASPTHRDYSARIEEQQKNNGCHESPERTISKRNALAGVQAPLNPKP